MTKTHKETDNELVKRALNKDQKAYSRLLTRYRDSIFYYILRMAGNKTDATDLTQETFDRAFRNLDKYNDQFAFSTWLYKIAKNCTIDFIRKHKLNILHINYGTADEDASVNENILYSGTPNPEENMIQQQEESMLMSFIQSMKPKYRQLIELRYINEYAYEEIAKELNIPLGTVKTQLFRAKNILVEKMLGSLN